MKLKSLRKKYTWLGSGFFMFCLLIGSDLKSATEQGPALAPRQNVPVANVELVEVVKAMYGNMDVTAQLRQMLKNNRAIQFNGNKGEMNNLFVHPEPNQDLFIDVKMGKTGRGMRYQIPSGQAFWLGDASVRPTLLGNSASTVGASAPMSKSETTTVAVPQAEPASPSKRGEPANFVESAAHSQATTPQAENSAVAVPQATAQEVNQASVAQPPTAEPQAATTPQGGKAQSSKGITRRTPSGPPQPIANQNIVKMDQRADKPLTEAQKERVKDAARAQKNEQDRKNTTEKRTVGK